MAQDPYKTLGVTRGATDAEVRSAYRRLVQLHHPDHNNGSVQAERRFEAVQEAYAQIREQRSSAGVRGRPAPRAAPRPRPSDPSVEQRMAELEQRLREARERADRAAREAAERVKRDTPHRPSDEELGYVTTNDSFSKILSDAREAFSDRLSAAGQSAEAKRAADLIEELGAVLRGERRKHSDD
jgi:curved DNA-binding protein CbpA